MQRHLAALVSAILIGAFLCLMGITIVVATIQRRRDRRRIMAEGTTAEAA